MRLSLCAVLLFAPAVAQAGVTLSGERLAVGVNEDGSLCDWDDRVCLLYDPDGMGRGAPLGSDMILPGRSFETWSASWRVDGEERVARATAPDNPTGLALAWDPPSRSEDLHFVEGRVSLDGLDVEVAVDVPAQDEVFWTTFTLTATRAVTDVELARTVDVDPDVYANGGYGTINEAVGEIAVASSPLNEGKSLALGVIDGEAGLCGWCSTPAAIRSGTEGTREGDFQIGVAWGPVDLAAGEQVRVRFAYALAMDDDEARTRARAAMAVDDLDGDGRTEAAGDCDDRDANVATGAPERADGRDNDCDGEIDEDTVISDDDGDGFAEVEGDCDDTLAAVYPGADPAADVRDADCDGLADNDVFDDGSRPEGWGDESVTGGGCTSAPALPGLTLLLLPLLILRRRA